MAKIWIYDTTLRDGSQGEGVNFSLADKLRITQRLDAFGVDYIEGGWPGSNPKDAEFFERARSLELKHAKVVAFGSTRRADRSVEEDPQIQMLLDAETPAITIFGKTWDLHVRDVLHATLEENLRMIEESVRYLKAHGKEVIYDAEHYFDGWKANPEYALDTLRAAERAGADWIVLCDTNGGSLPWEVEEAIRLAREAVNTPLGIHAHNDSGLAVANSLVAVRMGCAQVQGTINGYGERCGNADLTAVIPNLQLKMGYECVSPEQMTKLRELSLFVSETANLSPDPHQPFVGYSAFSHKGGAHVNAMVKNERT
ncbi:MAG: citramalate synthase, partial [Anaerolineae bacterium]|nr:citramalate synthase [Anaerolineae bacterium]